MEQDDPLHEMAEQPTQEDVLDILRSDQMRGYRVDVETDSTIQADQQKDQKNVADLLQALAGFMQAVIPGIQAQIIPPDVAKEMLLSVSRRFKLGRALEDSIDQLSEQMNAPKGPDPAEVQAMAEQVQQQAEQVKQAQAELEQQQQQIEAAKKQIADQAAKLQSQDTDLQAREVAVKHALEMQKMQDSHRQQMDAMQAKCNDMGAQLQAANTKSELTEIGAKQGPQIVDNTQQLAAAAQSMAQMMESFVQMQAQRDAAQDQQMQVMLQAITADRQIVRGPDGKAQGTKVVLQ